MLTPPILIKLAYIQTGMENFTENVKAHIILFEQSTKSEQTTVQCKIQGSHSILMFATKPTFLRLIDTLDLSVTL